MPIPVVVEKKREQIDVRTEGLMNRRKSKNANIERDGETIKKFTVGCIPRRISRISLTKRLI